MPRRASAPPRGFMIPSGIFLFCIFPASLFRGGAMPVFLMTCPMPHSRSLCEGDNTFLSGHGMRLSQPRKQARFYVIRPASRIRACVPFQYCHRMIHELNRVYLVRGFSLAVGWPTFAQKHYFMERYSAIIIRTSSAKPIRTDIRSLQLCNN
jgi:hypothetical protein